MNILVLAATINSDLYSASLTTINVIKELRIHYNIDILTPSNTVNNFNHPHANLFYFKTHSWLNKGTLGNIQKKLGIKLIKAKRGFRDALKKIDLDKYDHVVAFGAGGNYHPHRALGNVKIRGKKWGYFHDPYPKSFFPPPYNKLERNTDEEKLASEMQVIFNQLDYLWFPSVKLYEWMASQYRIDEAKFKYYPHPLPKKKISNSTVDVNFKKYGVEENKFFLHTGTLLKNREVKDIIRGFEKAKYSGGLDMNQKLLFVGGVNYEVDHLKSDDVLFIKERIPYDEVVNLSKSATALMIIEHKSELSPFLPAKVPEYLAAEKKVMHFGPKNSECNRLFGNDISTKISAEIDDVDQISEVFINGGVKLYEIPHIKNQFSSIELLKLFQS